MPDPTAEPSERPGAVDAVVLGLRRHATRIVVLAFAGAVLAGVFGAGTVQRLTDGGLTAGGSDSSRVAADPASPAAADHVVMLYRSATRRADAPEFQRAVQASLQAIPPGLLSPTTSVRPAPRVSRDGRAALVVLSLAARDDNAQVRAYREIACRAGVPALRDAGVRLRIGGDAAAHENLTRAASDDLRRVELVVFPLLLIGLVVVFRGVVAALLPLLLGGLAVTCALALLRLLTLLTDVSTLALNVVTMLGLGLAVDYALLVVTRFREELAAGADERAALLATCRTAGRTIAVSATIVTLSLAGLLCMPIPAVRSLGVGGMMVASFSALASLTVLPALLALLGRRVNALGLRRSTGRPARDAWARLARRVMRRPVASLVGAAAILVACGVPFLHADYGMPLSSVLPSSSPARVVAETAAGAFDDAVPLAAITVTGTPRPGALDGYTTALERLPGVRRASVTAVRGDRTYLAVASPLASGSARARDTVTAIRAVAAPTGATAVLVGGPTAELLDTLHAIGAALPWTGLVIGLATGVLLMLAFRSLLLPLKALAVAGLSLTASFGVLVWGFQDGHLDGILDATPGGHISATVPVLVLAIVFGLAMDYEMFLLSRIREEWLRTGDNGRAVAAGVQRTGGIITSAAFLLLTVTVALATARVPLVAMIGVGLSVAIALDATLVRLVLVPAAMRLMGDWNWWLPRMPRRSRDTAALPPADEPAEPVRRQLTR